MFAEPTDAPATWKDRARNRSLAGARQRADDQVTRLVHEAQTMVNAELDVTVPALVARLGMSTKTFYRHFATRDELLLAVMEEELAIGAHFVAKDVDRHDDPVERFHTFVVSYVALPSRYRTPAVRRSRASEGQRLRAIYPQRAREASAPVRALLHELIDDLVAARLIEDLDVELTSRSVLHLLNGHLVEAAYQDTKDGYEQLGAHTARICRRAIGLPTD